MADMTCKLLVVGAGPGGYACAIRAGQLGVDTILVEARRPGGTCLTVGCIPSKALIHAAETFETAARLAAEASPLGIRAGVPAIDLARTVAWKDGIVDRLTGGVAGLLRKAKVRTVEGRAIFRDGKTVDVASPTGQRRIRAEMVVIATGSEPVELPVLPFGGRVISSTEALSLGAVPKRLVVVGAGYIGLELGGAFARLGSNVAVVEAGPRILPHYDEDLTRPVETALRDLGVEILLGASALGLAAGGDALRVRSAEGAERELGADRILVTAGRRPATEGWGIEALVLERNGSFIRIDETCRTSMRGVYAIGDVTGEPMLAHRAMAQGEMVAEIAAGRPRAFENRAIPAVCYTDPAIVSVGLAPEAARRAGHQIVVGQFPFHANGRALATEATSGFVRVVARAGDHLVLGIQAVGRGVPELSAAFGLAVEMGARLEDVAGTIHAHPTLGEAVQEAAFAALGHPLHI